MRIVLIGRSVVVSLHGNVYDSLVKYKRQRGKSGNTVAWDAGSVRSLREHIGLTQQEMAERLGVRQQTISEWETEAYKPRGASVTLLGMVAKETKFTYKAGQS